jgi:hypothetical protein
VRATDLTMSAVKMIRAFAACGLLAIAGCRLGDGVGCPRREPIRTDVTLPIAPLASDAGLGGGGLDQLGLCRVEEAACAPLCEDALRRSGRAWSRVLSCMLLMGDAAEPSVQVVYEAPADQC